MGQKGKAMLEEGSRESDITSVLQELAKVIVFLGEEQEHLEQKLQRVMRPNSPPIEKENEKQLREMVPLANEIGRYSKELNVIGMRLQNMRSRIEL